MYKVYYPEIPEGKTVVDWTYSIDGDKGVATPELIDTPLYVPQSVSKAQGKAALLQKGYYFDVIAFLDALEEPNKTLAYIAFDDTSEWQRDSPFLAMAASELSLTEDDLDELFILAETITL